LEGSGIVIVEADSPFNVKCMAEKEEYLACCITPKITNRYDWEDDS
jgi:hypothetical protein